MKRNVKKKIIWTILLLIVIAIVVILAIILKPRDKSKDNMVTKKVTKNVDKKQEEKENNGNSSDNSENNNEGKKLKEEYIRKELKEGILYSKTGEKITADKIIPTEYFDTTINDMYVCPDKYENKNIEIEGLFLTSDNETFVGRISTVTTCPYCAGGFSYLEYKFDGKIKEELKDQDTWIKVIGTWEKEKVNYGTEEHPYYDDNYYLKVKTIEVMHKKGQTTIKN